MKSRNFAETFAFLGGIASIEKIKNLAKKLKLTGLPSISAVWQSIWILSRYLAKMSKNGKTISRSNLFSSHTQH